MIQKSGADNTSQPEFTMAEESYIELCLRGGGEQKNLSDAMKAKFVSLGGKLEDEKKPKK